MIKRGIVFIILLSFLLPLLFSCSSSSENSSSGGIQHIYEDSSSDNAVQVSGIKIASNYIELVKEAGMDLQYNISAVIQPENAENKTLHYTSSNPDIAEVSPDGYVTIKDFGTFNVKIQSGARQDIWQQVDFYVRENILTNIDVQNNPLSFFGSYTILQYGIDKEPDTNIGGSLSINMDRAEENAVVLKLLFNGLDIPVNINMDNLSDISYEEAGVLLFSYLQGVVKDNDKVIIKLKADEHASLIEQGVLQPGQTLYLSLKKDYDLVPGQSHVQEIPVSVTDIQVKDKQKLDRLISTTYTLNPVVLPVNASNKAVTYSTNNDKIVSVSPTGVVTALSEGTADITVTSVSNGEVIGTTTFNVIDSTVRVKDIVFENMDKTIYIGSIAAVQAQALPDNATYKDIVYYSKNPSIATVNSATGVVTPRRKGTVEIAAVSDKGSFEKTITLNVGINEQVEPVKGIINIPSKLEVSLESQTPIQLSGKVVPTYADNTTLIYKADESGSISVDENGLITPLKVGTGVVTISSAKYPDIKKEVSVAVRQDEEKVYVTSINVNEAPSTLYIGHTDHTIIPEIIPANANVDHELTAAIDDTTVARLEQVGSGYKVTPLKEGSVIVTLETANGVTQEVQLNVKKVMNVKGYYTIDKVEYTLGTKTETFTPENDNLQGEFAINLLEDKYNIKGRLQLTPQNPLTSYTFNNWRYIYENKEIMLDIEDKFATQTKEMLSVQNIKITSENTIEYTYTQDSFKAVVYLTKVNDEVKEILDRTMYLTPVNMEKDPHSAEGYYEMTWFYGNPYNKSKTGYQPKFSHNASDRPTNSDLGISYLENGRMCVWPFKCMGGDGPDGSVASYKGSFAVKVDGTEKTAGLSSIMKVQMAGHEDVDVAWQQYLRYIHAAFNAIQIDQSIPNGTKFVDNTKTLTTSILSNDGKTYPSETVSLAYNMLSDNYMQFEMDFHKDWPDYEFMYKAKKVSDRYIDLPTEKYVAGDVSGRTPPTVPELAVIVPVEAFTGTVTAIE